MKRFKKLTIYILVGVLLSSSVMLSYRKADEVKAAATLTLGTGALLMIGLLGACGIVYKGAIDSATGDYVWESALPKYEDDINELEDRFRLVWDSSVNQIASGGGYDPNDEWNGDEDKPPTWDNLVNYVSNQGMQTLFKLGATVLGSLVSAIGYAIYQESQSNTGNIKSGVILNLGDTFEYGYNYTSVDGTNMGHKFEFDITNGSDVKTILVQYDSSDSNKSLSLVFASTSKFGLSYAYNYKQYYGDVSHWSSQKLGPHYSIKNIRSIVVDDCTIYFYQNTKAFNKDDYIYNTNLPIVSISYNLNDTEETRNFLRELFTDEYSWGTYNEMLNQENIGISSDIKINGDNGTLEPILPLIQIPTNETVGDLLGNLVIGTGNQAQTQLAVDQFVDSLQGTDPNPEGGTVPNPNPKPNPNPDPNPDDGEQGGEDSEEDEDNSSLLADLKNVFPFCIPFDLVNCFKLFNAEPVTPRVEIPLHFGIIDKDYTFVIDLKDFDGVAEVCRAMFLILFIVGLVLSTRSLIRG